MYVYIYISHTHTHTHTHTQIYIYIDKTQSLQMLRRIRCQRHILFLKLPSYLYCLRLSR